jgi:ribosomal protein L20
MKAAGITIDRKILADLAATESAAFAKVAAQAKAALPPQPAALSMHNTHVHT